MTKEELIKMAVDQNNLQKVITLETGMRERTIKDIELSLIEEILEWNKERGEEFSHKTWKKKEFDKEKHDEEFIDILFFELELFNKVEYIHGRVETSKDIIRRMEIMGDIYRNGIVEKNNYERNMIKKINGGYMRGLIAITLVIAELENVNIIETFYKKLKINYNRFGYDYDVENGEISKGEVKEKMKERLSKESE
jgi:hypothetical protein